MSIYHKSPVCLAVLNPKGKDPFLDYGGGPDHYDASVHPPVNFHAYAAATYGAFFDSTRHVLRMRDRFDAVLVLIRRRAWLSLAAVEELKAAGMRVIVAWKECSHNQVSRQLKSVRALRAYGRIIELADGILTPTFATPPLTGGIGYEEFRRKLRFIPTPYPVDLPSWDFSKPLEERVGMFIGTREFKTESRNHVQAIARAASLAHRFEIPRVTVINSDGRTGLLLLRELAKAFPAGCLSIHETRLPYPDYMRSLASHRLVFQMDRSTVPGQVAGDSLLARTICAGGSSTIEKMAFGPFSDDGSIRLEAIHERIERVLHDDGQYQAAVGRSQFIARESLSFEAAARQFGDWEIVAG
jgi:hypothetical protein